MKKLVRQTSMFTACMFVWVVFGIPDEPSAAEQKKSPPKSTTASNDVSTEVEDVKWAAIRKSAEKYASAYNAGDAQAIAALYAKDAELVDASGTTFRGREAISKEYEAFFEKHPDATLLVVVDKVTFVSPSVAIEDGKAEVQLGQGRSAIFSQYMAVHTKVGDQWLLASVRDKELVVGDRGNLEEIAWLIGQWVDEAPESLIEIDCYWHESGAFLMRDFRIKIDGLLAASGTERIGWDPLTQQVRSWIFDSDGGFMEGNWVRKDEHWTVTAHGFRGDGEPIRATYLVTPLRKDAYHITTSDRTLGDVGLDDLEMTIVRRPPQPGKKSAPSKAIEQNSENN